MSFLHTERCALTVFTLEAGLCRATSTDKSAAGGLMGHLKIPSPVSSEKYLGVEWAGQPAIRATGVAGNKNDIYIYIYV